MLHRLWLHFKRKYLPYPFVYLAKGFLRLILSTCRIELIGLENLTATATKERCIIMLWHNRLAIMAEILTHYAPQLVYCAFISKSRDGELLAILTKSYQAGRTLRVPHNVRHQALSQMITQLKSGGEVMIITPDGPRGPRYQVKPGIVLAAQESEAKIIPVTWSASRFFQLKTWDRLILPKPFSKIQIRFGAPQEINKGQKLDIEKEACHLQQYLRDIDLLTQEQVHSDPAHWPS